MLLEDAVAAPSRALVCGTAKTVHRYRAAVERLCPSVEARALEVLCFQPDPAALRRAALRVLESQEQPQGQKEARPLHVIVTSAAAVRMLQEAIDEIRGNRHECAEPSCCAGPLVLTVRGCGTEVACRRSSSFANVLFCGDRLCDIYSFLRGRPPTPTLLLGVRSGGDRSYQADPALRASIEFIGVYDTRESPGAATAVQDALRWAGARCHVVVTSSKSAELVAQVVQSNRGAARRELTFVAQGKSTAAALHAALPEEPFGGERYRVLVALAPTAEAVAAVLQHHPTARCTQTG